MTKIANNFNIIFVIGGGVNQNRITPYSIRLRKNLIQINNI